MTVMRGKVKCFRTAISIIVLGNVFLILGFLCLRARQDSSQTKTLHGDPISLNIKVNATHLKLLRNAALPKRKASVYPTDRGFNYILNNVELCGSSQSASVLFVVHTAVYNWNNRQSIRSTYANQTYFGVFDVRVVFLLGYARDRVIQSHINQEYLLYGDIVQGDFYDSYHNLTFKAVMGFHWTMNYCKNAHIVAKIDDDIFIRTPKIFEDILPTPSTVVSRLFYGNTNRGAYVLRTGKWAIHKDQLRHYTRYPWHVSNGAALLFSGDMAPLMYKAATFTPFFWVDDIYITGMILSKIEGFSGNEMRGTMELKTSEKCFVELASMCSYWFGIVNWKIIPKLWKLNFYMHKGLAHKELSNSRTTSAVTNHSRHGYSHTTTSVH